MFRPTLACLGVTIGSRFGAHRNCRTFLWWKMGHVRLMLVGEIRLCRMVRPGNCFRRVASKHQLQEPWYLGLDPEITRKPGLVGESGPRTGAYRELVAAGHNLHELHALMAPRPFLVSGGAEDPPKRWAALQHAIDVNRLLGFGDRVAMTNRDGHAPTTESNEQIYAFLEYWLTPRPNAEGERFAA